METLAKHFREITRAAFARHGFAQADVATHWDDIVGAELARHSLPERITWPRGPGGEARKAGGTLVVRAAPGRALDLQYETPRLIGRINSYFGYEAVAKLRIVQTAGPLRGGAEPGAPAPDGIDEPVVEAIDDQGLKAALQRLGRGVATAAKSSPQSK